MNKMPDRKAHAYMHTSDKQVAGRRTTTRHRDRETCWHKVSGNECHTIYATFNDRRSSPVSSYLSAALNCSTQKTRPLALLCSALRPFMCPTLSLCPFLSDACLFVWPFPCFRSSFDGGLCQKYRSGVYGAFNESSRELICSADRNCTAVATPLEWETRRGERDAKGISHTMASD